MARFAPLPEGTFSILFAKPPWCKRGGIGEKGRLSIHDLTRLKLLRITAANAVLSILSPLERIEDTILLGRLWGFRYVGVQFLCVRLVPNSHTPFLGASSRCWTRSNVEVVLLFSRGNPRDCVRDKTVSQLIFNCADETGGVSAADTPSWQETVARAFTTSKFEYAMQRGVDTAAALFFEPRIRTTFKPAQLLATLERIYADLPRCVLFATEARERWAVWGDLPPPPPPPPPPSLLVARAIKRERAGYGASSVHNQARQHSTRSYAQYIAQKCELYEHQRAQEAERAYERERRRKRSKKKSKARAARRTQTRGGARSRSRSRSRSRERNQ
jgi:N6-adenosine-specific RNA methylase IME4